MRRQCVGSWVARATASLFAAIGQGHCGGVGSDGGMPPTEQPSARLTAAWLAGRRRSPVGPAIGCVGRLKPAVHPSRCSLALPRGRLRAPLVTSQCCEVDRESPGLRAVMRGSGGGVCRPRLRARPPLVLSNLGSGQQGRRSVAALSRGVGAQPCGISRGVPWASVATVDDSEKTVQIWR